MSNSQNATPTTRSHSSSLNSSPERISQSSSSKFRYAESPLSSPPKDSSFSELSSIVSPHLRRSGCGNIPRRRFEIEGEVKNSMVLFVGDPETVAEAMQKEEWIEAMEDELKSIQRTKTWEMTDLPKGKNTINLKLIFKTKFLFDGSI